MSEMVGSEQGGVADRQITAREWGEFGKKVMEFRRRLPEHEQSMLDQILHAAFVGTGAEGDVQGYSLFTGAEITFDTWPTEPPPGLNRIYG